MGLYSNSSYKTKQNSTVIQFPVALDNHKSRILFTYLGLCMKTINYFYNHQKKFKKYIAISKLELKYLFHLFFFMEL